MNLNDLFKKYNCDKSEDKHGYVKEYQKCLEPLREKEINVLEVGVWKGTSVSALHDYLPKAEIYGLDIFTRVPVEDVPVLKRDRVQWLKADSTSKNIQASIKEKWRDVKFDVIIDDGLHTPEANAKTFENLIPFLKDDGVFYIEDVWPLDIMTEQEWKHSWISKNKGKYNMNKWKVFEKAIEGYNVERIDLRKESNMPDSYIFKITK